MLSIPREGPEIPPNPRLCYNFSEKTRLKRILGVRWASKVSYTYMEAYIALRARPKPRGSMYPCPSGADHWHLTSLPFDNKSYNAQRNRVRIQRLKNRGLDPDPLGVEAAIEQTEVIRKEKTRAQKAIEREEFQARYRHKPHHTDGKVYWTAQELRDRWAQDGKV